MVKKADIVELKGSKVQKLGIVDKIIDTDNEELAVVRWFRLHGKRTYLPTHRLVTLRTSEEAAQRGRKKIVPGLQESTGFETRFKKSDEDH
tara:strand:- start:159 stop:431 length:273 start_codon:yes stop_codon:yes gene_type:complete